jgi:hypothetical protein
MPMLTTLFSFVTYPIRYCLLVTAFSVSLVSCGGGGSKEWDQCVSDVGLSIKNPDDYWRAGAACEIQFRKEGKIKLMPSKTQANKSLDYLNNCLALGTCRRY